MARPLTWRETRARLRADAEQLRRYQESRFGYRPQAWFADPSWVAVLLHRLSAFAWRRAHPKTGRLLMQLNSLLTGADIHPASDLGPGLLIPSPCGVTISGNTGRNVAVLATSGLGGSIEGADIGAGPGLPIIGDDVVVGPFAGVQHGILVGHGATIGGGAGALKDVPPGGRMVLAALPLAESRPVTPPTPHAALPPCPHRSWRVTCDDIRADIRRYLGELPHHQDATPGPVQRISAFLTNPVLATALHRVAHWLHARGWGRTGRLMAACNLLFNRLTITPASCIGGSLFVPHLAGTLFCGHAGRNLTLYANSLCAPLGPAVDGQEMLRYSPILGDNVTVSGQSAILGPVRIGSEVRLAAKVQLHEDVPPSTVVFSPMARFAERATDDPDPVWPDHVHIPPVSWRVARATMRRRLRDDRLRFGALAAGGKPSVTAMTSVRLHRLSHALFSAGRLRGARWTWLLNAVLTGADISPASDLGAGLLIPHPAGVLVHATAGAGLTLLAQSAVAPSGLAGGRLPPLAAAPLLGDDVHIDHHAAVFGRTTLGSRVQVCAGCIVTRSVAGDTIVRARPVRMRHAVSRASGMDGDNDPSSNAERSFGGAAA